MLSKGCYLWDDKQPRLISAHITSFAGRFDVNTGVMSASYRPIIIYHKCVHLSLLCVLFIQTRQVILTRPKYPDIRVQSVADSVIKINLLLVTYSVDFRISFRLRLSEHELRFIFPFFKWYFWICVHSWIHRQISQQFMFWVDSGQLVSYGTRAGV